LTEPDAHGVLPGTLVGIQKLSNSGLPYGAKVVSTVTVLTELDSLFNSVAAVLRIRSCSRFDSDDD
jgi:hypothetical protein